MPTPTFIIDVWSDFRCPFCFIADALLQKMERELEGRAVLRLARHSFELYPDAPRSAETTILDTYSRKYGLSKAEAEEKISAITEAGRKAGINNFNYGGAKPTSTFDAHRLCKYGIALGHPEIYDRLMEAYFCDNIDLADRNALADIAAACGMEREQAAQMLATSAYAQQVRDDEHRAMEMGIRSVPCFVLDGQQFLGSGCMADLKKKLLAEIDQ